MQSLADLAKETLNELELPDTWEFTHFKPSDDEEDDEYRTDDAFTFRNRNEQKVISLRISDKNKMILYWGCTHPKAKSEGYHHVNPKNHHGLNSAINQIKKGIRPRTSLKNGKYQWIQFTILKPFQIIQHDIQKEISKKENQVNWDHIIALAEKAKLNKENKSAT
jgi:hypothetical protein